MAARGMAASGTAHPADGLATERWTRERWAGTTVGRAEAARLPWPVAALTIGSLSLGLWLGIGWLIVKLV